MPPDSQFSDLLKALKDLPPFNEVPLELLRSAPAANPNATPVDSVTETTIPGPGSELKLRIYRSGAGDALPVLLFMHGGGFVFGGLDTHDEIARILTKETGCVTVAVDYRLAPENPYPAALDDCFAALEWTAAHAAGMSGDARQLVVIGDSAGGNLAAALALKARDENGPPLAAQVLIYPVVDLTAPMLPAPDGEFYVLDPATRAFFNGSYLSDPAQATLPLVSPGLAPDLTSLPATLVIAGEYDPLCAQAEAFAGRLLAAGVETTLKRYDGAVHGFVSFPVPMQGQALRQIAQWLQSRAKQQQ